MIVYYKYKTGTSDCRILTWDIKENKFECLIFEIIIGAKLCFLYH